MVTQKYYKDPVTVDVEVVNNGIIEGRSTVKLQRGDRLLDEIQTSPLAPNEVTSVQVSADDLQEADVGDTIKYRVITENASAVVSVEVSTMFDSVINYWPADEGSGSTLNDVVGSNDILLNFNTWRSNPSFEGGTAPDFDGANDEGTTSANTTTQAWSAKVDLDTADDNSNIFTHDLNPRAFYRASNAYWAFDGGSGSQATVSESNADATSAPRIVICGSDGTNSYMFVYDETGTEIGSSTVSGSITFPTSPTLYLGSNPTLLYFDGAIDQIMQHNQWLDSQQRSDLIKNYY